MLHDASLRTTIEMRVRSLRPDLNPRWGRMSVDQMLWHVNEAMAAALGEKQMAPARSPLPRPMLKFLVLNLPWMKGAPTNPAFLATAHHDFDAERQRCLGLIESLAAQPLAGVWSDHPMFGRMSGRDVSRLHAKHLDHHLRQFGV